MLNSATAKTVSALKISSITTRHKIALGIVIALVCSYVAVNFVLASSHYKTLHAPHANYRLKVANTPAQRMEGLSARTSMATHDGMLFDFNTPVKSCFWMRDMLFPLDIIWLDSGRRVVHVQPGLSPKTYPKTYCTPVAAQYVVELNAGQAQSAGLNVGVVVGF
ncbi:MAG TPA: DUF192 domain-containing protein [Candidatus Saccharimonadales bacterium]|nr:DUF192 domain-containing protein [Candidatus Saccharimonadales bacterium]